MLAQFVLRKRGWHRWLALSSAAVMVLWLSFVSTNVEAGDDDLVSLLQDAAMYSASGQHAEAETCYRRILETIGPSNPSSVKTSLALAGAIERQGGRNHEAAQILLQGLDRHRAQLGDSHPSISQMLVMAVRLCNGVAWTSGIKTDGSQEEYDRAAEFAEHAVKLQQENSWWWLLGLAQLRQGDPAGGLKTMKRSLANTDEAWIGQWFIMAMVEAANDNRQAARDWYAAASDWLTGTRNTWGPNLNLRGQAAEVLGLEPLWPIDDWTAEKRIASLTRLITDYPAVPSLKEARGLLYINVKKFDAGEKDLRDALQGLAKRGGKFLDDRGLRTQRGNLLTRFGRWKEAAEELEKGLHPTTSASYAWLHIAPVWALSGERDRYVDFCRRMRERFKDSDANNDGERVIKSSLLIPNAIELSELPVGKLERALRGQGVEPWKLGWGWGCLGLVEVRRGNPEEALACIETATEQPDYESAQFEQALCHMVKTLALIDLGRMDEARQAYAEGTRLFDATMSDQHDVLIAEILRQEADQALGQKRN